MVVLLHGGGEILGLPPMLIAILMGAFLLAVGFVLIRRTGTDGDNDRTVPRDGAHRSDRSRRT